MRLCRAAFQMQKKCNEAWISSDVSSKCFYNHVRLRSVADGLVVCFVQGFLVKHLLDYVLTQQKERVLMPLVSSNYFAVETSQTSFPTKFLISLHWVASSTDTTFKRSRHFDSFPATVIVGELFLTSLI